MTEAEKCECGMWYDTTYPGWEEAHILCADLCYDYNHTRPSQKEERERILRSIFGGAGEDIYVEPNLFCGFGKNVTVGNRFFANNNCIFMDNSRIVFGDDVFIGPNCGFYTASHPLDSQTRNRRIERAAPIIVGSSVWFGGGCTVLPGVTIGSDVVIGAGSVVTRDIPDHVLAFGNPCRVQRVLTENDRAAAAQSTEAFSGE